VSSFNALDEYHFGSVYKCKTQPSANSIAEILKQAKHSIEQGHDSWFELDEKIWKLLSDWRALHSHLQFCRCGVALIINKSDSPVQISRIQLTAGKSISVLGSHETGYEVESRSLFPNGALTIFICAFSPSPMNAGYFKASVSTGAFTATLAYSQRETFGESKGGFKIDFLEKTVNEYWCKYVLVLT
jgi:hypothetical protein